MTPGFALFVKTPGRSPVKSRLWPSIGRAAAEALYLDCASAAGALALQLQRSGIVHPYWAVAEADAADDHDSPWQGLARIAQGDGGLGERMAAVYEALRQRHGAALLMGTDVPQATAAMIAHAAGQLTQGCRELVIGPSDDGGFWLVGGSIQLPLAAWTAPRYSTAQAKADFLAALPAGVRVQTLPALRDLDEAGDLAPVAEALAALGSRMAEQSRVLHRLDALRSTMTR